MLVACVGQNLARMELLFMVEAFFRHCPDVALAPSADEMCMRRKDYFTAKPTGGKVEVILATS
jgi:cytochrome P450